jgi:hypothetical protein
VPERTLAGEAISVGHERADDRIERTIFGGDENAH